MKPLQLEAIVQLFGAALLVLGGVAQAATMFALAGRTNSLTGNGSVASNWSLAEAASPLHRVRRQANAKSNKKTRAFELECLAAHNKWRRLHQANDLVFDKKITAFSQKRADFIAASDGVEFRHPNDLPYGENLAWHSRPTTSCSDLIKMWYDEVDLYDFRRGQFDHETGHFTQLVWRNTERVGCARAISGGRKGGIYLVCNYDPPGNFLGEALENVFPRKNVPQIIPQPIATSTIKSTTALALVTPAPPQVTSTTSLITPSTTASATTTTSKPATEKRDKNEDGKRKKKGKKNKNKKKNNKKNKNKKNKNNKNKKQTDKNNKPTTATTSSSSNATNQANAQATSSSG